MANSFVLSDSLTSRKGAWFSLGFVLLILVALFGFFTGAQAPERTGHAPLDSESMQVEQLLQKFPDAAKQSVLIVVTRDDGAALNDADLTKIDEMIPVLNEHATEETQKPRFSDDGEAAVLVTALTVGENNTATAELLSNLRADIKANVPAGLNMLVTGGPAFGADVAAAFDGADFTLLLVTVLIVALLLIITYRSPVLWLVPLIVVAIGNGLAGRVTAAAGETWSLEFDAGIISVLVFGAGTNYALLLISRYREELQRHENHRVALSIAWRKTLPAIIASNLTVVLALLSLVFASIPLTRGLAIPAAIGLVIALSVVLFMLPPLLAILGRKTFWPFIPKPGKQQEPGRAWRAVALQVTARPAAALLAGVALLAVMATGLFGSSLGLSQLEKFRVQSESATGLEVLSEHFPAGEAQPIFVVANSVSADQVVDAVREAEGVVRAVPVGSTDDAALTKIMVTSEYEPSTAESLTQIVELRETVHKISDADALVGGAVAVDFDAGNGNEADLLLVAPLVLAVSFVVLLLLLRSFVAPVLLILVNLASAIAAIGAGSWLSRVVFGQPALDLQVPLLAFLFLVALGIDYTIFLVHRAQSEMSTLGTRAGMVEAVTHTGSVITSAGIVLAAVFAALGVLPLVTLGQLGLIVGMGVLVDTFVVRTAIVPAIFCLLGDRIWWPKKVRKQ